VAAAAAGNIGSDSRPSVVSCPVGTTVADAEKVPILETLKFTGNNKDRAAKLLGLSSQTLSNKLREYGRAKA